MSQIPPRNITERNARLKIAVAFFGIARSLKYTIHSIEENVLEPLENFGDIRIYGHFYNLTEINNPRSGEACNLQVDQHKLIKFNNLIIDEPDYCLSKFDLDAIYSTKDPYLDNYKSIKNLLHQLHSLESVTRSIEESWEPDFVVFVRPDLCYHNSFIESMKIAIGSPGKRIYIPTWQRYGGYNDRFAICDRNSYIDYGGRANLVNTYVNLGKPLLSEIFLYYALNKTNSKILELDITASRVRGDSRVEKEQFFHTDLVSNTILRYKKLIKHSL